MKITHLEMSWGISKGRETYGYNIARLVDTTTGERFRCLGGGYDMQGTVFGEWLEKNYQAELMAASDTAYNFFSTSHMTRSKFEQGLYGMTTVTHNHEVMRVSLDGACGLESMFRIAESLGLELSRISNRKGHLTGILVTDYKQS